VDDVDLRVSEERVQVACPLPRRARDEVVPLVDPLGELDAVALCLPPLDAAKQVGAALPWACGSCDADRAAVTEGAGEDGERFQDVNLPCSRSRVRRWVEGRFAGSRR